MRFCTDEWSVLRERPRRKTLLQYWAPFGWQGSLWDLKIDPYSIPSDKKRKPAQHISNLLFPVEISQNCSAKPMAWKEMGGGKGTLNYSIFLNPDLLLDAILPFFPEWLLGKEKEQKETETHSVPQ